MNIVYAVKNYHPAHAGIVAALQSEGHSVLLLFWSDKGGSQVKNGANYADVEMEQIEPSQLFALREGAKTGIGPGFPRLSALYRRLKRFQPDVMLVYSNWLAQRMIGVVGRLAGAERLVQIEDKPKVLKSWKSLPSRALSFPFRIRRRMHNGFYGRVGEPFDLGPLSGRSWLSPYPVDPLVDDLPRRTTPAIPVRILCMGISDPSRARMEYVLEAVARAGLEAHVEVTFIRSAPQATDLESQVRGLEAKFGLPPSDIRSDVTDQELRRAFREYDLLVFPSRNNPYGQTVGEALAHGLPVLCCDSLGAHVLIEEGVNGSVFATWDLDDFANRLKNLVEDPALLACLSEGARIRAAETHSSAAWLTTFHRVIA